MKDEPYLALGQLIEIKKNSHENFDKFNHLHQERIQQLILKIGLKNVAKISKKKKYAKLPKVLKSHQNLLDFFQQQSAGIDNSLKNRISLLGDYELNLFYRLYLVDV